MTDTLISVVIPHFNRAELLGETIASIMESSEQRFEVIVVDDGSTMEQLCRVKAMQNAKVRVMQRTDGIKGPSRCRNLGVAASTTNLIMFVDSDDLVAPWCLENRLALTALSSNVDFWVFPVLTFRDHAADRNALWNVMRTNEDDVSRFLRGDSPWHTSSALWKKESLEAVGGFNEEVLYGDDSDLHLRALLTKLAPAQFPDALPDVFIRRSNAPRITNSLSTELVASRRTRLREATRFMKGVDMNPDYRNVWEGQYFMEAEFLLFNHETPTKSIRDVLDDWELEFQPSIARRRLVRTYFSLTVGALKRPYVLIQLARRVAMRLMPPDFFPREGEAGRLSAPPNVMADVHRRLDLSHFRQANHVT